MRYRCWIGLLGLMVFAGSQPLLAAEPKSTPDAAGALKRGDSLQEKGDYDGAIAAYTDSIRLDPKDARAYLSRGWAHVRNDESDKAITDCTVAIRLDCKAR